MVKCQKRPGGSVINVHCQSKDKFGATSVPQGYPVLPALRLDRSERCWLSHAGFSPVRLSVTSRRNGITLSVPGWVRVLRSETGLQFFGGKLQCLSCWREVRYTVNRRNFLGFQKLKPPRRYVQWPGQASSVEVARNYGKPLVARFCRCNGRSNIILLGALTVLSGWLSCWPAPCRERRMRLRACRKQRLRHSRAAVPRRCRSTTQQPAK